MDAKPLEIKALDLISLVGLLFAFLFVCYLVKAPVRPIPFLP
ncbi:MAG: hypothetical protein ACXACA_02175 [Candidatus Ranarchaeia archaeon]